MHCSPSFRSPRLRVPTLGVLPLLLASCAARVADPGALALAPEGEPARTARVCWIEFATGTLPRGVTVAHHALEGDLVGTQSGLLVEGPAGRWLFDGGMAADVEREIGGTSGLQRYFLKRASSGWTHVTSPEEGLRAAGVDPAALTGAMPTHGHFDHLGGLLDLPGVPLVVPEAELGDAEVAASGKRAGITPADGAALLPRATPLVFDGGPLWLWHRSHDLLGDGSVVVVPMEGHTPGSVGVRVLLPDGRIAFLVGDTVWAREGYEQLEPKSWLAQQLVDADGDATAVQISRLAALHRARPDVLILPAHDRRAWLDVFGEPGCLEES